MFSQNLNTWRIIMSSKLDLIQKNIKNHGIGNTLYQVALKTVNKVFFVNVLTCIVISKAKESSLAIDLKFQHGFLDDDKLSDYARDHENELPQNFLESAINKGDECYAVTEDGKLAAFGWYSNKKTITDVQQLKFCFDPSYIYMYKGLTKKDYRGQRLHAVGMSWALNRYLDKGYNGIVSYVESTNFDSLKSCYRMGYEKIGDMYIAKVFGKVIHYPSKSCRIHKVRLEA
jgi:L-amino acid N-acyltransferase YncA